MIFTRKDLQSMKMAELKNLYAQQYGGASLNTDTKESLIDKVLFESAKQRNEPEKNTPQAAQQQERVEQSINDVLTAVNAQILKGMKVYHSAQDKTWLFVVKLKSGAIRDTNTGEVRIIERERIDSGTLKQPMKTIKRCAQILTQNIGGKEETPVERRLNITEKYESVA